MILGCSKFVLKKIYSFYVIYQIYQIITFNWLFVTIKCNLFKKIISPNSDESPKKQASFPVQSDSPILVKSIKKENGQSKFFKFDKYSTQSSNSKFKLNRNEVSLENSPSVSENFSPVLNAEPKKLITDIENADDNDVKIYRTLQDKTNSFTKCEELNPKKTLNLTANLTTKSNANGSTKTVTASNTRPITFFLTKFERQVPNKFSK